MIIYCITNNINGKQYVGLTMRSIEERFREHCKAESVIGRAIRKYGVDSFSIEVIDTAETAEELWEKESHWIKEKRSFHVGYNRTSGEWDNSGYSPWVDVILTDKQKRFVRWVIKENQKDIDVNDEKAMKRSIIINTIKNFLLSNESKVKRKNADLISRLQPVYLEEVMETGVIDKQQVNEWIA